MSYEPKLFPSPTAAGAAAGGTYVFSDRILVALDVALATGRPLLIGGPPGSGKTTLAKKAAGLLNWRFLSKTVTSRTRLEDLQAEFDNLQRLADAQLRHPNGLPPDWTYLRPGVLWWAFDPEGASHLGSTEAERVALGASGHRPHSPLRINGEGPPEAGGTVVLLDEIDKADPDLPNDLLEPLDRRSFGLQLQGEERTIQAPPGREILLMLTTNGERELPPAFLRRCVVLDLVDPAAARGAAAGEVTLEDIAAAHFPHASPEQTALFADVAETVRALGGAARSRGVRPPSTAEYLDTLRALGKVPDLRRGDAWGQVQSLLLRKDPGQGAVR